MGHNKLYRNFIILQEDSDYSKDKKSDKMVSGYAKIEAKGDKCKVSFYVQNLKNAEKYYMLLICYKKDNRKIVNLGSIEISESGKAEITKEYYVNNIGGLNFSFEEISGASICKMENESLKYILYGFSNGELVKDDWKKCKVYDHDEGKEKYIKDTCLSDDKKQKDKDDYKKSKSDKCSDKDDDKHEHHDEDDAHDDKHKHDHYDDDKHDHEHEHDDDDDDKHDHDDDDDHEHKHKHNHEDEHCKECKHIEDDDQFIISSEKDKCEKDECKDKISNALCEEKLKCNRELKRNKFDEYEAKIESQKEQIKKVVDPYNFNLAGKLGDFFEGVVKDFKEIKNKFKEIKYCKWYKADVLSIEDMCNTSDYNKYTIAYYPMMNYYPYIKKYGYFVMGYKCDENGNLKYIVYGVPGSKNKESQPYGGKTGFVTWMKTENENMGLWLMFYDYKKSMVVIPKRE